MLKIQSASCLNPIFILNFFISVKQSSIGAAPHSSVSSYTHMHTYTVRHWAPARTCWGHSCTQPHPMQRLHLTAETAVASSIEQQYNNRSTYNNASSRNSSSRITNRYLNNNSNRNRNAYSNNNSSRNFSSSVNRATTTATAAPTTTIAAATSAVTSTTVNEITIPKQYH